MGKLAILKIDDGDFEQGFWVTLRIGEDGVFNGDGSAFHLFPHLSEIL